MKVEQHAYLSPKAMALRRRDGIPPWGVHPCEVDALALTVADDDAGAFATAWREAARLRAEIEGRP